MDLLQKSPIEQSYETQCSNLRKQISILQAKISFYENDNAKNKEKLAHHIKVVQERDGYLQRELEKYERKVQEMEYAFNERNDKIASLESTINDLKEASIQEKNQLYSTLTTDKDNITYANGNLMQEVSSLKSMLVTIKDDNYKLNAELTKTKEEIQLYDQDNTILLQKIQDYEDSNSILSNQNNQIEVSYAQKNNECIKNEKLMLNNDNALNEYTNHILNELSIITQWIDTYLGISYPVQFECPSLTHASSSFSSSSYSTSPSFLVPLIGNGIIGLKKALENAKVRIMNEQHILEASVHKQKNDINDLIIAREKKQHEINQLKAEVLELAEQCSLLQQDNESYLNEHCENKTMLAQFRNSIETIANDNDQYLQDIIVLVKKELEEILRDPSMKSYHSFFLSNSSSSKLSTGISSIQLSFEDLIDKLLHLITLLKEDVKEIRRGNELLSSDSLSTKSIWVKELNELNVNISGLKRDLSVLESALSQVKDENSLLLSQISILENTIQSKEEIIRKLRKDEKRH